MASFRFFVYSNFFIAICAVVDGRPNLSTVLHGVADRYVMAFVFFSTICSYSFSLVPELRLAPWLSAINMARNIIMYTLYFLS